MRECLKRRQAWKSIVAVQIHQEDSASRCWDEGIDGLVDDGASPSNLKGLKWRWFMSCLFPCGLSILHPHN